MANNKNGIDPKLMYKISKIKKYSAQYNFIFGERSNGKSYAVKHEVLQHYLKTGQRFVYMRRYDRDISTSLANQYFSNLEVEKLTKGKQNVCYCRGGRIYIANFNPETEKNENVELVGYTRSIAQAQRYSSGAYDDVDIVVLEEFMSLKGDYLPNECMLFKHIISTIARKRLITVYLIGNTLHRLCPYFKEFGLTHVAEQLIGTIDCYEVDGVKIAVEYCSNVATKAGMSFGSDDGMTNRGEWLSYSMPHLDNIDDWNTLYDFIVEYDGTRFLVQYIHCPKSNEYAMYISSLGDKKDIRKNIRIFGNQVTTSSYYSRGFEFINPVEKKLLDMTISHGFFEDDLVGTEYVEVYKKLRRLDFNTKM